MLPHIIPVKVFAQHPEHLPPTIPFPPSTQLLQHTLQHRLAVDASPFLSIEQPSDLCGFLQGMWLAQGCSGQTVEDLVTQLSHGLTQSQEQSTHQYLPITSQTPAQLTHQISQFASLFPWPLAPIVESLVVENAVQEEIIGVDVFAWQQALQTPLAS
jgi:hypothetical protein